MKPFHTPSLFTVLPDEIKIKFAEYMSPNDLINAALVAKSWSQIYLDNQAWQKHWQQYQLWVMERFQITWPSVEVNLAAMMLPHYQILCQLRKLQTKRGAPIINCLFTENIEHAACWYAKLPEDSDLLSEHALPLLTNLAAGYGNLKLVQWLVDEEYILLHEDTLTFAIKSGNLALIDWLINKHHLQPYAKFPVYVAETGKYKFEKLLNEQNLDFAAKSGNFKLVKWLMKKYQFSIDDSAIKYAAESGNLEMLKWFVTKKKSLLNDELIIWAASSGNLRMVKWLIVDMQLQVSKDINNVSSILANAASSGNLDLLQWLCYNQKLKPDNETLTEGTKSGSLQVLKWLVINKPLRPNHRTFTMAALFGNLSLLKWLISKYSIKVDNEILNSAVASNNLVMVQWLIKNKNVKPNTDTFYHATTFGSIAIMKWLIDKKHIKPLKRTFNTAIRHCGEPFIINWLENRLKELPQKTKSRRPKKRPRIGA